MFFIFYSVPTIAQLLHTLVESVVSAISSLSEPYWCGSFIAALFYRYYLKCWLFTGIKFDL